MIAQNATADNGFVVRDIRRRDWFSVDNSIIDRYAAKVGPYGLSVYLYLARWASNNDQTAYGSFSMMADRLGMARSTAQGAVKDLIGAGLLGMAGRKRLRNGTYTNVYVLLRVPDDGTSENERVPSHGTRSGERVPSHGTQIKTNKQTKTGKDKGSTITERETVASASDDDDLIFLNSTFGRLFDRTATKPEQVELRQLRGRFSDELIEQALAKTAQRIADGFSVTSPIGYARKVAENLTGNIPAAGSISAGGWADFPSVVEQLVVASPVVEQPVVASPVVEQPVVASPVVEQPVAASPVVEQPVAAWRSILKTMGDPAVLVGSELIMTGPDRAVVRVASAAAVDYANRVGWFNRALAGLGVDHVVLEQAVAA